MRYTQLLPLAALSAAIVIPDEVTMRNIAIEPQNNQKSIWEHVPSPESLVSEVKDTFASAVDSSKSIFDEAVDYASEKLENAYESHKPDGFDASAWLESAQETVADRPHGKKPHHAPNQTVYQLIASSKYTTKLAGLVDEFPDLVQLLNGTAANYTVFAPIDSAFEKIPEGAPKPSKEVLKKVLTYHVSSDFYPAGRVLVSHTIPTLFKAELIGGEAQRVSTNIGLKGLTVNFYSRIVAVDIFGTNGVIHGIDSLLIPPPKVAQIIDFLPSEFSTLELGLLKTDLLPALNDSSTHVGGTVFAPSNFAFQKLGPRINGFLFSTYGQKYLKALLQYHIVANQTLYSDAYYEAENAVESMDIPKGYFHIDLPTLLEGKSLSIDVGRYGRLINIKINGFSSVSILDGIASDGVIHVISSVLIPPKSVGGVMQEWQGEELSVEEFKERFAAFVQDDESEDWEL
ncbi:hypothetical protein MMC25_004942 [Agyrium rufum]|nr:hypothetical protein [Agyrium rufum]